MCGYPSFFIHWLDPGKKQGIDFFTNSCSLFGSYCCDEKLKAEEKIEVWKKIDRLHIFVDSVFLKDKIRK